MLSNSNAKPAAKLTPPAAVSSSSGSSLTTKEIKAPNTAQKLLQSELDRARATLTRVESELDTISNKSALYGETAQEMEAHETALTAKLNVARARISQLEGDMMALNSYSISLSTNENERSKAGKFKDSLVARTNQDLHGQYEERESLTKELIEIKDTCTRVRDKERFTQVQSECCTSIKQLERLTACNEGDMMLKCAPANQASATEAEKRAIKRAADVLASGDVKRICCVTSTIDNARVGFACHSEANPAAAPDAKKKARDKIEYVESDEDDENTSVTTVDSTVGDPHLNDILLEHLVCISTSHVGSAPCILLIQQPAIVNQIFTRENGDWCMPLETIRKQLIEYARENRRKLAWLVCSDGDKCGFCKGIDLAFDCVSTTRLDESDWTRPEWYGGGKAVKYAHNLSEASKPKTTRRKRA